MARQIGEIEVMGRVSVGFAESRQDSLVDSLLGAADMEMYLDKQTPMSRTDLSVGDVIG